MRKIRIKKDIACVWRILTNGASTALSGRDLKLRLVDPKGKRTELSFEPDGNAARFRVPHALQVFAGVYGLEMWENVGGTSQTVADLPEAFELVHLTTEESNGTASDIEAASADLGSASLAVGVKGDTGAAGSDASVTEENIILALGYTPADEDDLDGKLDKPTAEGSVGQVLKKTASGTEWANEQGSADSAVRYTAQTLTDTQKTQARTNIGAASSAQVEDFQTELAGKAAQSDVETLQTDVETLQADLAEITGGEVSLEVEYKTGAILNTSGNLTKLAGYKYAQVDLEGYEGSTVHVKTTTGNQYISLWSLSAEEFVIGTAGTVIAKGQNCSVSKEADIDLSLYPSARYLYIGCYSASTVATATAQTPNRVDALEAKTGEMRYAMNIKKTDSDCDIYVKMLRAYRMGNTDVFFEKADYAISDMYVYVRDVLHINMGSYAGLPIGNNCRYYFNGSKLTATRPDGYEGVFNILDAKGVGGNFELYDVELVCIDGHYCVHDEAASSRVPYLHKYENVVARFVTTQGVVNGCKPIGGGTGYDATVEMTNCSFLSNNTDTVIAYHGPSERTATSGSAKFHLRISGCHLSNGISFNQTYFHEDDDNTFFYCNNYHYYAPVNTNVFGTVVMKDNNVQSQLGDLSSEITALSGAAVKVTEQTLTDSQKAQARANIGAAAEGSGGGSAEWKCVYDGEVAAGEKNIQFTTFADGTALHCNEVIAQILIETTAENERQAYLDCYCGSSSLYFGAIVNETTKTQPPYLSSINIYAYPHIYAYSDYHTIPVRAYVAQRETIARGFGGVNTSPQVFSYLDKIVFRANSIVGTPFKMKIYAR